MGFNMYSVFMIVSILLKYERSQKHKKSKKGGKRKRKPVGSKEEIDLASGTTIFITLYSDWRIETHSAFACLEDDYELQRSDITLVRQLGIGEYGPIYDAEVKVKKNLTTRALVKVTN